MIHLILFIALIGLIVYLITTYIPMPQPFKTAILVLAAIFVIYLLMGAFGIADVPLPRLR